MSPVRPILVVGCARSGTTMLQLMLHAHPRIAIGSETRFVLEGYRARREFGDLAVEANRRRLAEWIVRRRATAVADLGLDADALVEAIVAAPPTLGSAFGTVFRSYAQRFGKPRWGDKRPAYIDNLDVLLRLFPTAQIVAILRDGRDCVASLKEMHWHRGGTPEAAAAWARAVDTAAAAARELGADTFHQVRYEDLVRDPTGTLRRVCAFLGEEYDAAMAEPARIAATAVPEKKTWHRRTREAVSDARIGSWRQRLTPEEIALCQAALGRRLAELGYPPPDVPLARPPLATLTSYRLVAGRRRLSRAGRRFRDSGAPARDAASLADHGAPAQTRPGWRNSPRATSASSDARR
ncbi:MAG TPA: sulfotransferase [Pilimelia sp.]|nr:sulfotransferase [Pilimelia sp.]